MSQNYDAGPAFGPFCIVITIAVRRKTIAMGKVCFHGWHYNAVAGGAPMLIGWKRVFKRLSIFNLPNVSLSLAV
jgi:hypothetical protein